MQVARLQSQLAAAQLDVQTAREQAALAAIEGPVSHLFFCHALLKASSMHLWLNEKVHTCKGQASI